MPDQEYIYIILYDILMLNHCFFFVISYNRWAIKQEDLSNIGQWKYSTIPNPEWNKRALSWPVNEDGTWNMVHDINENTILPFTSSQCSWIWPPSQYGHGFH